jgi:hypothetical protein
MAEINRSMTVVFDWIIVGKIQVRYLGNGEDLSKDMSNRFEKLCLCVMFKQVCYNLVKKELTILHKNLSFERKKMFTYDKWPFSFLLKLRWLTSDRLLFLSSFDIDE